MPSTVVHIAFAVLFAAALLGTHYDRRTLVVVAAVAAFPDLDAFTSVIVESTHRAAFHTLLIPIVVATATLWDTHYREQSWLRERYGARGIRVIWVSLFGFVVSAVGLDLFTAGGVNLFYPLYDQFFAFTGKAGLKSGGFFQTYVDLAPAEPSSGGGGNGPPSVDIGQRGSTQEVHVGSGVDPTKGPEKETVRRRFPIAFRGWHLLAILSTGVVLHARSRIEADTD